MILTEKLKEDIVNFVGFLNINNAIIYEDCDRYKLYVNLRLNNMDDNKLYDTKLRLQTELEIIIKEFIRNRKGDNPTVIVEIG